MCTCVHTAVIQPSESQVALPGDTVIYTCHGEDSPLLLFIDSYVINGDQIPQAILDKGINVTFDPKNSSFAMYTVTINASVSNNETRLLCLDTEKSPKVFIYTVEGETSHTDAKK